MTSPRADIIVLGSGPAGLAAAAACVERGLRVTVVAPAPDARWTNGYGAWREDLDAVGAGATAGATWPVVAVHTGERAHRIARPYARIDNDALQGWLRERMAGAALTAEVAVAVEAHRAGATVTLSDGTLLPGRVVIDATGHGSPLVARSGAPSAWQTAYGRLVEADGWPEPPSTMTWMDFRVADPSQTDPPSFLYAMPLPDGRLFVEETSLAASPAVSLDLLRERLDARLARMGVRVRVEHGVERCRIPMDAPLPVMPQRVVAFGGAASMVHPATGYLVARALAAAPRLADALVRGLERSPEAASRAGWAAVWPSSERRTRTLHDFGLKLLLGMDTAETTRFFDRFFQLPARHWRAYLDASARPLAVASAMAALFPRLDTATRRHVLGLALGAAGRGAARELVTVSGGP